MATMTAFKICCMQSDAGIGIAATAARLARCASTLPARNIGR